MIFFRKGAEKPIKSRTFCLLGDNGIALLMVLWILVMLSLIALNFMKSSRWNSLSATNLRDETVSYYMALSAYNETLYYLMSDKDMSFDMADQQGNFLTDNEAKPVTGERFVRDCDVNVNIIDEDAKININNANADALKKMMLYAGIDEKTIPGLIDSILDWKGPGNVHRLEGAGDEYYEGLEVPYKTKKAGFDVPEELLLVKGMKPEYLYGGDKVRPLISLFTTFGNNMNINTVTPEVMSMLGLDQYSIETILKQRTVLAGGFKFVPQQFSALGLNAIASRTLRIEITARPYSSNRVSKIEAVVSRVPSPNGFTIQTLYWRESAQSLRS